MTAAFEEEVRFQREAKGCWDKETCLELLSQARANYDKQDAVRAAIVMCAEKTMGISPKSDDIEEFLTDETTTEERFAGSVLLPMILEAEKNAAIVKQVWEARLHIARTEGFLAH